MKIICIEGLDGSGKETISRKIKMVLTNLGYDVEVVSFPRYNGKFGEMCKYVIDNHVGKPITDNNVISLVNQFRQTPYILDRMDYFNKLFSSDGIENLDFVICDRSFYSSFLYGTLNFTEEQILEFSRANYHLEFKMTPLHNELLNGGTIHTYLMIPEDRMKMINSRDALDNIESNDDFMDDLTLHVKKLLALKEKYTHNIADIKTYITNVTPIEVAYGNTIDEIEHIATDIAKQILSNHITIPKRYLR